MSCQTKTQMVCVRNVKHPHWSTVILTLCQLFIFCVLRSGLALAYDAHSFPAEYFVHHPAAMLSHLIFVDYWYWPPFLIAILLVAKDAFISRVSLANLAMLAVVLAGVILGCSTLSNLNRLIQIVH